MNKETPCELPSQCNDGPSRCSPIVIRNFFSVDHFSSPTKYFFLTNPLLACGESLLNQNWKSPLYCSQETADLLPLITRHVKSSGVRAELIRPLKIGQKTPIEPNFYVTAIKSDFCTGSVMFLFEGASVPSSSILCTGPFRADRELLERFDASPEGKLLQNMNIGQLYIDNTHFEHENLPTKEETVQKLTKMACENSDLNIVIPLEAVGYEDVLQALADNTGENLVAYKKRYLAHTILRKCAGSTLGDFCEPPDPDTTRRVRGISIVKRNKQSWDSPEPFVVVDLYLDPSQESGNSFVHLPYPKHSSKSELEAFICRFKFGQLIPTAFPFLPEIQRALEALSRPRNSISPCGEQENRVPTVKWEHDVIMAVDAGELHESGMEIEEEPPQESASEILPLDKRNLPIPMVGEDHALETDELNEALLEMDEEHQQEGEPDVDASDLERQLRIVNTLLKPKKYEFRVGNIDLSSMAPPIRLGGPAAPKPFSIIVKGSL